MSDPRGTVDGLLTIDVFVSYSSHDRVRVQSIVDALRERGVRIWIDLDVRGGDSWNHEATKAIKRSKVLLLMGTRRALDSDNVYREIKFALEQTERHLRCVPVALDSIDLRTDIPERLEMYLKEPQWIHVRDRPDEEWIQDVLQALDRQLSARSTGPRTPHRFAGAIQDEPVPHFRGRSSELNALRNHFLNPNKRLILVDGPPGVGKSALVSAFIRDALEAPQGVIANVEMVDIARGIGFSLDQSPLLSPDMLIDGVCQVLPADAATELRQSWRDKSSLLEKFDFLFRRIFSTHSCLVLFENLESVLDGLNHLTGDAAWLELFIERCMEHRHAARVVVTSRRALRLPSDVSGKFVARIAEVRVETGLAPNEAIDVLRALDCDDLWRIRESSDQHLTAIVMRLHCLPSNLEKLVGKLAHERVDSLNGLDPAELDQLTEDPARVQYERLTEEGRLVVQALAIYGMNVPDEAVAGLLPDLPVREILRTLERNFAITFHRTTGTYALRPLDQQYAIRQMEARGSLRPKRELHERAASFFKKRQVTGDEGNVTAGLDDKVQEFRHLLAAEDFAAANTLMWSLDVSLTQIGYSAQVIQMRSQLDGRLSGAEDSVKNYLGMGWAYLELGEYQRSIDCNDKALAIVDRLTTATEAEIRWMKKLAFGNLGVAWNELGNGERAVGHSKAALALAQLDASSSDGAIDYGSTLGNLGDAYKTVGDYRKAISKYEHALKVHERASYSYGVSTWLGNLGRAWLERGDIAKAEHYFKRALTLDRDEKHRRREAADLRGLGRVCHERGALVEARRQYDAALTVDQVGSFRTGEIRDYSDLGDVFIDLNDLPAATDFFRRAEMLSMQLRDPIGQSRAQLGLGLVHHLNGELSSARRCYEDALAADVGTTRLHASVKLGILILEEQSGGTSAAQRRAASRSESARHFSKGIRLCEALLRKTPDLYDVMYQLALAQLGVANVDESLRIYRQALSVCAAPGRLAIALRDVELLKRASSDAGLEAARSLLSQSAPSEDAAPDAIG